MGIKYKEIIDYIMDNVQKDNMKAGDKIPSIRQICKSFNCSKSTALKAYEELQREDIIYSHPQSGFYVVEKGSALKKQDSSVIDFSSASPSAELLPYREFHQCMNQAIKIYKEELFGYTDIKGSLSLRKTLKKQLTESHMFANAENIVVTSGSQQALYLLSKIPFPNGKSKVLVEQPTYLGMLKALEYNKIETLGISRDANGFNTDELERLFKFHDIKFFYIMPRFQNPTGYTLSNEQKRRIVKLAEKYDVYIVEDDFLADLELDTKADTMFSMDVAKKVVYIRSFSKTMLPGLRMGFAVLPEMLVNEFLKHKVSCDFITNPLSQGALDIYIRSRVYENHVEHIKLHYRDQMRCLENALNKMLSPEKHIDIPETGFFSCLNFRDLPYNFKLSEELAKKKVNLLNIGDHYLPENIRSNMFRISVCKVSKEQICKGVGIISETLKRAVKS